VVGSTTAPIVPRRRRLPSSNLQSGIGGYPFPPISRTHCLVLRLACRNLFVANVGCGPVRSLAKLSDWRQPAVKD